MNTYEQTNSVNYRHFIKGHRAKHKSKTKPPKSLPLPSVFSLLLKNGSFIMLSFPTTHFSQTPRLHWFFFFPFWQNCFSFTGARRASESTLSPPSHWQSLLCLTLWWVLSPTDATCLDYILSAPSPGTAHRFLFSSTIPPPFQVLWEVLLKNMPLQTSYFPLVPSELSHQNC